MPKQSTRVERFCAIRDAIMTNASRMTPHREIKQPGFFELRCGPFLIVYGEPRGVPNVQIWPAGKLEHGHILHGDKVANVDWDGDYIHVFTFKSGPWEAELLELLRPSDNVRYLAR